MISKQDLLAARSSLQMVRAARGGMPTKISGEDAIARRMSEAMAPRAAEMPKAVAGVPSRDTLYIEHLRQVLNSPHAVAIDITSRER